MREYTVERTAIESQWLFKRMIPSLPGPGSPPFAKLIKELAPFGIDPGDILVDAPTSRLSDVALVIGMLDRRLNIRITSRGFDFNVTALYLEDEQTIPLIATSILTALGEIDSEVSNAEFKIRISSHLTVDDVAGLLAEHLAPKTSAVELVPNAVVYDISSETLRASQVRAVIARSLAYQEAVFFDLNATYSAPLEIPELVESISADFDSTVLIFGLTEK